MVKYFRPLASARLLLLITLGIPIIFLTYFSALLVSEKQKVVEEMETLKKNPFLVFAICDLVHEIQKERGYSSGFIASRGATFKVELAIQRKNTDDQFSSLLELLKEMQRGGYLGEAANGLPMAFLVAGQ